MPKARGTHIHKLGVERVHPLPGQAPAWQHLGAEIFHDGVTDAEQLLDELQPFFTFCIETDGELAVMQGVEVGRGIQLLLIRSLFTCRFFAQSIELRVRMNFLRAGQIDWLRIVAHDARYGVIAMTVPSVRAFYMDHLCAVMCE